MKYLKNVLAFIGFVVVIGSLVYAVQKSTDETDAVEEANNETIEDKNVGDGYQITAISIPDDLNFAGEPVPLEDPEVMERADREFLVNTYWQSNALLLMKRANKYFPIIEPILAKNGIPDDFKYVAVAESALIGVASPAGAAGMWHFMKGTGKEYGLEVNANVDERYHLEKATEVACRYLKESKEKLGSWTLAAAAYNAGKSGVSRRLEEQKVTDYYDLLLGEETGRYMFRIVALKEILSNPKKYGFNFTKDDLYQNIPTYQVEVDSLVQDFAGFAKEYGINYKILKIHNPWLREDHLKNASKKKP